MPQHLRSLLVFCVSIGMFIIAAVWNLRGQESAPEPLAVLRQPGPSFWKGNLHTHTLWSDGDDFPEMVADWYRRHDYQFLMLSDHNLLSEGDRWIDATPDGARGPALKKYQGRFGETWIERREHEGKPQVRLKPLAEFRTVLEEAGRFLLVPGEEITSRFLAAPVHLNAVNLRDVVPPLSGASVAEAVQANLRAVAEQRKRTGWRTVTFLNHPNFGWGVKAEDLLVPELRFFEIFNGHPSVRNYGDTTHPGCERLWDIALALRLGKHRLPVLYGLATDDAHTYHAFGPGKANPGRGWVMVRAPHLTPESIVSALDAGDFYASSGVVLTEIRRDGADLTLAIRPQAGVTYRTEFIATLRDAPLDSEPRLGSAGETLAVSRVYSPEVGKVVAASAELRPSYRLTGRELYVRARVTSSKAHPNPYQKGDVEMAWTQPITP